MSNRSSCWSRGRAQPLAHQMVVDFMKTQPLDFTPGARYAYSNFGYSLLGRLIERITGLTYERYVRDNVLAPIGILDMRVGQSLLTNKLPAEADYGDPLRRVVNGVMGAGSPSRVPVQYGGWNISTMDSHGGWVATASDLARFITAFDSKTNSPLLSAAMIDLMWSRPPGQNANDASYYGAGWAVRPLSSPPGTLNAWHSGLLDGTFTYFVRLYNGINWVALFNKSPSAPGAPDYVAIDPEMNNAVFSVASWPAHNLFDADGDGLLDSWELYYFGTTNTPNGGPTQDADGDGTSNLAEYTALTDPTQPASFPKLETPQIAGAASVLRWVSKRGRLYTVEFTTNLTMTPAWTVLAGATNRLGDGTVQAATNGPTTTGNRFYRFQVKLRKP